MVVVSMVVEIEAIKLKIEGTQTHEKTNQYLILSAMGVQPVYITVNQEF